MSLGLRAKRQETDDWYSLDVNSEGIELNFSAKEVQDITQRRSSFSETFTLPFIEGNDVFFEYAFNVNIDNGYFNPNGKTDCIVDVGSVSQLEGYLQLIEVNVTKRIYTVAVFSQVADLYAVAKSKHLRELDLTDYDHRFDTNLSISWNGNLETPDGLGTVPEVMYPIIDWGAGYNSSNIGGGNFGINPRHMKPAIKMKSVFDAIVEDAGFTYTSAFLNTSAFTNLWLQCATDTVIAGDAGGVMRVGMDFNNILTGNQEQLTFSDETGVYYDVDDLNVFSGTQFVPKNTGRHYFRLQFDTEGVGSFGTTTTKILVNGVEIATRAGSYSLGSTTQQLWEFALDLNEFDILTVELLNDGTSPATSVDVTNGELSLLGADCVYNQNIMYMADLMPNIKQGDFIKAIFERFNLIVDASQDDPKNLIIEPFNDYYDAGDEVNWTGKLDTASDVVIKSLHDFHKKSLVYSDAEDVDRYNQFYQDTYDGVYGSITIDNDGDFADGEQVTTPVFSPFIPVKIDGYSDFIIAKLYKLNSQGNPEATNVKPKFFYFSGLETISTYRLDNTDTTQYPICTMYEDSPITANSLDYHWGNVYPFASEHLYGVASLRTIWSEYHKREFNELYSDDARMLKARFILSPFDIATLKLNHQVFVKDTYYRINKITGYKVGQVSPCTIELIKIFDAQNQINGEPIGHDDNTEVEWRLNDGSTTYDIDEATARKYGYQYVDGKAYWKDGQKEAAYEVEKEGKYDNFQELRGIGNSSDSRNVLVLGNNNTAEGDNQTVLGNAGNTLQGNSYNVVSELGRSSVIQLTAQTTAIESVPFLDGEGLGIVTKPYTSGTMLMVISARTENDDTWHTLVQVGYRSLGSTPVMVGCITSLSICNTAGILSTDLDLEEGTHTATDFIINAVSALAIDINWTATVIITETE